MQTELDIYRLKIDEEFKRLIPQLSEKEKIQLEKNIIKEGCRDAICVWNKTILDGHNRYEICIKHQIPFAVRKLYPKNRAEAMVWICSNQLGRRNIDNKTRQYLIGKRYEMEKIIGARNAAGKNQHTKEVWYSSCAKPTDSNKSAEINERDATDFCRTRGRLAKEYNVSSSTINAYASYAQAMDRLSEVVPELREKLVTGTLKMTQKDIIKLTQLPPAEIRRVIAEFSKNPTQRIDFSSTSAAIPKNMPFREQLERMQIGAIKDMPEYDPDAEIRSLTLTIPSWASSIKRVLVTAKFEEASENACSKLDVELRELKLTIDSIGLVIKERKRNG